ncbi:MAG: sugar ABC transporter permease [Devosia nanyangense]|uniref:Sugar ABC transporter permease n=1 Tax=Devosia nanyangense TaxID=1228055 RepID=A0A933NXR2_9HYPH|nr:sugar ABC transporter permease [Devosia nanyangense]
MHSQARRKFWIIASLLAPALAIYTVFMIYPLVGTLQTTFYQTDGKLQVFAGLDNYRKLFFEPLFSHQLLNALGNNFYFFFIHMLVQNPIGIALAAVLSVPTLRFKGLFRSIFFLPTMLSVVVVGFIWQLILSPLWGVSSGLLGALHLGFLFKPWLGLEGTALTTLSLMSVWQNIGIPMMLIYAALLSIPDEILDAARIDGANGWELFWGTKLPLIMPTIALTAILTFIGNFNAFDLVFATQGALGLPNFSTDILGTFMFRTFFGNNLQQGDLNLGATIAMVMFFIILVGVSIYLFVVQRRITSYQL